MGHQCKLICMRRNKRLLVEKKVSRTLSSLSSSILHAQTSFLLPLFCSRISENWLEVGIYERVGGNVAAILFRAQAGVGDASLIT